MGPRNALFALILFWGCSTSKEISPHVVRTPASDEVHKDHTVALVGDIQAIAFVERILNREDNDKETQSLLKDLSKKKFSSLFILGDAVTQGSSDADWIRFDKLVSPIKKKSIPVLGVLGNHDYWGSNDDALKNAYKRFPELKASHWYSNLSSELNVRFLKRGPSRPPIFTP